MRVRRYTLDEESFRGWVARRRESEIEENAVSDEFGGLQTSEPGR